MVSKKTQERIKADAQRYASGTGDFYRKMGALFGYIAGATSEHERAQPVIDFLEEIAESSCDYESTNFAKAIHSPECRACKAKALLQQWKGEKEPERPCPHCGKELSRDRNLCCRECGKEVGDE